MGQAVSNDRHSVRAMNGPSLWRVAAGAAGTAMLSIVSAWTTAGVPASPQAFTGFALGMLLALSLAVHTVGLFNERELADRRRARQGEREQRARREIAESTGTWSGPDGLSISVRWDEQTRGYWVSGWVWDQNLKPAIWPNLDDLASYLIGIEAGGWIAADDIGTRLVRAKLDLPGWQIMADTAVIRTDGEGRS